MGDTNNIDEENTFDVTDCPELSMEVAFEKSIPAMHTMNAAKILFSR